MFQPFNSVFQVLPVEMELKLRHFFCSQRSVDGQPCLLEKVYILVTGKRGVLKETICDQIGCVY